MNGLDILDFAWGNTQGLREKILSIYTSLNLMQTMPLKSYGYPPDEGDPELVELIKKLTKNLTGKTYNYVCITAGCTQAINASIYALSNGSTKSVNIRRLYYPLYPSMISMTKFAHQNFDDFNYDENDIVILDSPSNPLGLVGHSEKFKTNRAIWDAAYHTPTYGIPFGVSNVDHKIYCGSLSKLTGINGIRLGWTATDDRDMHNSITLHVKNIMCGVSYPSQYVAKEILKDENKLIAYFLQSRNILDMNREEVLRLKNIFGQDHISPFGMFAFFKTDNKMENLFKKANVRFTSGKDCGADYPSVRINLANSNNQTKLMVERIIKNDRR